VARLATGDNSQTRRRDEQAISRNATRREKHQRFHVSHEVSWHAQRAEMMALCPAKPRKACVAMGLSIEWERSLFQVGTPMSPSRCVPSPNEISSHFVNAAHLHEIDLGARLAFDSSDELLSGDFLPIDHSL